MTALATAHKEPAKLHTLVALTFADTLILATSTDAILHHLQGRWPTSHALRTIYSAEPITYGMGERFADLPEHDNVTALINLI